MDMGSMSFILNNQNFSDIFHLNPILKYMKNLTGKDIEKMAVLALISYLENQVDQITVQSIIELERLNEIGAPPL